MLERPMRATRMFTLLDEALNLADSAETTLSVSSLLACDETLRLMVRRDLAAVQGFGARLRREMAKLEAKGQGALPYRDVDRVGKCYVPLEHVDDDRQLAAICAGCEGAVQRAIEVGIINELPPRLERVFRRHLVCLLRRRFRLEDWLDRREQADRRSRPTLTAAHIFLIQPNAVQSGSLARQLLAQGVSSGVAVNDHRAMLRFVRERPLLAVMRSADDADTKHASVSILSVARSVSRRRDH